MLKGETLSLVLIFCVLLLSVFIRKKKICNVHSFYTFIISSCKIICQKDILGIIISYVK